MAMHTRDSISPSSPWLPPDRHLTASASSPPPPPPLATTATLHHLRAAGRRVAKRRPRPSRRLPTTYISADPANFRRMVHQVTGAADLRPPPPPAPSTRQPAEPFRPVPTPPGSAGAGAGALMLPTLDTSAYLLVLIHDPEFQTWLLPTSSYLSLLCLQLSKEHEDIKDNIARSWVKFFSASRARGLN
ncbi:hypothetical protein ABZP36_009994 [Zizania latifolia]